MDDTGTDDRDTHGATAPGQFEESRAGFDESENVTAGRGVADGDEVLARDFADRDIVQETVQRDFANRDITPHDVAQKSVSTGMGGDRTSGTSAREGMVGDTGFQGEEPVPGSASGDTAAVGGSDETVSRRTAEDPDAPRTGV